VSVEKLRKNELATLAIFKFCTTKNLFNTVLGASDSTQFETHNIPVVTDEILIQSNPH